MDGLPRELSVWPWTSSLDSDIFDMQVHIEHEEMRRWGQVLLDIREFIDTAQRHCPSHPGV